MHRTCRATRPGRRFAGALAFSAFLFLPEAGSAASAAGDIPVPIASATVGQQYGAGATLEGAQSLSAVMAVVRPESTSAVRVKVRGTVSAVCQRKGCWFDLTDESSEEPLRVTLRGYSFFVPADLVGATVVIEGDLARKERSVAELQHLAEDAGKSPQEIDAIREPQTTWNLVAHGLLVLAPSSRGQHGEDAAKEGGSR